MASEKKSQFPLSPFESSQKKDPNYLDNSRVDESTQSILHAANEQANQVRQELLEERQRNAVLEEELKRLDELVTALRVEVERERSQRKDQESHYQREIENFQGLLSELRHEKNKIEAQLKTEVDALNNTMNELESSKAELSKQNQLIQQHCANERQKLEQQSKRERQNLMQQLDELSLSNQRHAANIENQEKQYKCQLEGKDQLIKDLQESLQILRANSKSTKDELEATIQDRQQLKAQLASKCDQLEEVKGQLHDKERELKEARSIANDAQKEIEDHSQVHLQKAEEQIQALKSQNLHLQQSLHKMEGQLKEEWEAAQKKDRMMEQLQQKVVDLQNQLEAEESELKVARAQITDGTANQQVIKNMNLEIEGHRQRVESLENQLKYEKQLIQELEESRKQLEEDNHRLSKYTDTQESEQQLQEELRGQIRSLQEKELEYLKQIKQLSDQVAQVKHEKEAMLFSFQQEQLEQSQNTQDCDEQLRKQSEQIKLNCKLAVKEYEELLQKRQEEIQELVLRLEQSFHDITEFEKQKAALRKQNEQLKSEVRIDLMEQSEKVEYKIRAEYEDQIVVYKQALAEAQQKQNQQQQLLDTTVKGLEQKIQKLKQQAKDQRSQMEQQIQEKTKELEEQKELMRQIEKDYKVQIQQQSEATNRCVQDSLASQQIAHQAELERNRQVLTDFTQEVCAVLSITHEHVDIKDQLSLIAKAVREKLDSYREQYESLKSLDSEHDVQAVQNLTKKLEDLLTNQAALQQQNDEQTEHVASLQIELGLVKKYVAELEAKVEQKDHLLVQKSEQLLEIEDIVSQLKMKTADLERVREQVDDYKAQVSELQELVQKQSVQKMRRQSQNWDETQSENPALEINKLRSDLSLSQQNASEQKNLIEFLEKVKETLEMEKETLEGEKNSLERQIVDIRKDKEDNLDYIQKMQTANAQMIEDYDNKIRELEGRIRELEEEKINISSTYQRALQQTLASQSESGVESLQDEIVELKCRIGELFNAAQEFGGPKLVDKLQFAIGIKE